MTAIKFKRYKGIMTFPSSNKKMQVIYSTLKKLIKLQLLFSFVDKKMPVIESTLNATAPKIFKTYNIENSNDDG
jgi:hypothetical protein